MKKFLKNPWGKLILGVLFITLIVFLFRKFNINFSNITLKDLKIKVESFGIWGPIIYIIFYILRPLILAPAAITSAAAGFIWELKGLSYLLIAANLSANIEFIIARYFARSAIEKLVKGKIANIDSAIEKYGFRAVLLIRLIPNAPWEVQNFSLGLTKVKFRDYFIATFFGIIPGSFALVYFGEAAINALTDPKNFWMIGVAVLIFVGIYLLQKYLRKRHGYKIR